MSGLELRVGLGSQMIFRVRVQICLSIQWRVIGGNISKMFI